MYVFYVRSLSDNQIYCKEWQLCKFKLFFEEVKSHQLNW